ncbi:MAG: xylan 1,4-beta-xylosidase [Oscillibacter sp.]|jgi:hypothetical protein|nr:xylan 1,4-beta-xylosidase [Oscillibacter sp.]
MAKRFEKVYSQGVIGSGIEILQDRETGVQYLYCWGSSGGGLTPLLDRNGKPVIALKEGKEE